MIRVGIGYDVHALVPGRRLKIGGVEIASAHGLLGHSDADVLLHAITDALLGAAGLGDIGQLFPDADPAFSGADSLVLLRATVEKVRAAGWRGSGESVFLARERHLRGLALARLHLEAAASRLPQWELFAEELRLAQAALSEITGEFTADDLLGEIFSRFCIGK